MLKVDNLTISYPNKSVIKNVNFELPKGSICFLSGDSGSGKTTLCLAIAGLILHSRPEANISGSIEWNGKLIKQKGFNPEIAITLENPYAQLTGLKHTVSEEIVFGLEMRGRSSEEMIQKITRVADKFKFSNLLTRNPKTLSGGEIQRIVIASSYVLEPKIWILDRPLYELDPKARFEFLQELKKLAEVNGTIIIITEEPASDIYSIATHLLTLEDGKETFSLNKEKSPLKAEDISTFSSALTFTKNRDHHNKTDLVSSSSVNVKELSFQYSDNQPIIFKDLELTVKSGECLWITGANGCGKTTLAKILIGILKPKKGYVQINDINPVQESLWKVARSVAYSFQNPDLQIFSRTLWDEVSFGPKALGYTKEKSEHLTRQSIDLFNLSEKINSHPHDLNRAEKKRLGLASTFAMDTPVIILDEPTQFQNNQEKILIKKAIIESLKNGKVLLVISHELDFIW